MEELIDDYLGMKKYIWIILLLTSCARAPLKRIEDSMRLSKTTPYFSDALSKESFLNTLKKHIEVMKTSRQVMDPMTFGDRKIAKAKYIAALEEILTHEESPLEWIRNQFDFYEVYGAKEWGEVMSTGYYEPKVSGALKKSEEFSQAVYATPDDLITVNLKNFAQKFPTFDRPGMLVGRLINKNLYPYYDRKEIDVDQALKGKNLEIAWIDPIDSFFIQIQGSGVIEFSKDKKIRIGYDSQNGHAYQPIGKFLTDVIPLEEMSLQRIRGHLKTLPLTEQQNILNQNPSYVFFKKLDTNAITYAGMEVSDGRTIATDLHLFPKGAMAFLDIEEPVFANPDDIVPMSWVKKPRLVFDQDTGGAIRGGGRVDLFFGQGAVAAQKAGVMKQKGRLYYLVPRIE